MRRKQKQRLIEGLGVLFIVLALISFGCNHRSSNFSRNAGVHAQIKTEKIKVEPKVTVYTTADQNSVEDAVANVLDFNGITALDLQVGNGAVTIEPTAAGSAAAVRWEVLPSKSSHAASVDTLQVTAQAVDGRLRFRDEYTGPEAQEKPYLKATLSVPVGIPLSAALGNGDLSITGDGALTASVGNGELVLHGSFAQSEAHVGNGALHIESLLSTGIQKFGVGNGEMELKLLPGSSVDYSAGTGIGEIHLGALPGTLKKNMVNATASGTLGSGGARLELNTGAGEIRLDGPAE